MKEGDFMGKTKTAKIKATRTQLHYMRNEVLLHMVVTAAIFLLILFMMVITLQDTFVIAPFHSLFLAASSLALTLIILALYLFGAALPLFYFLFHLLPKYRRIDSLLYPEDYEKWMRLQKTQTHKLPKEDVQNAYRIYKQFRLNLPAGKEELESLLAKELKKTWYRRLTIAMLCGLLLNCPDFTDTNLLHRAMTERKSAAQLIFPTWIECMEGRTIHGREIIARQFLTYWDKKLFPRR